MVGYCINAEIKLLKAYFKQKFAFLNKKYHIIFVFECKNNIFVKIIVNFQLQIVNEYKILLINKLHITLSLL